MSSHNSDQVRVLLIDSQAVVRQGLRLLIDNQLGLTVVGETDNARDAVELAALHQPDIIVFDLDAEGEDGLEFIALLIKAANRARILVLTGLSGPDLPQKAASKGAMGFVLKEQSAEVLMQAIRKVNSGEAWFGRTIFAHLLSEMANRAHKEADPETAKIATLTEREREVIRLVGEGLKNKQIGKRLFISESTVRHHLTSVFAKLGVSDRSSLMIYAFRNGLADPPR